MPTLSQLKRFFTKTIERGESEIASFKEKIDNNPVHAFIWAEKTMQATARAQVAKHYLGSIETWEAAQAAGTLSEIQPQTPEEVVEFIHTSILNQAIRRNSNISRSTSTTSNYMEQEENTFYAYIASEWDFMVVG